MAKVICNTFQIRLLGFGQSVYLSKTLQMRPKDGVTLSGFSSSRSNFTIIFHFGFIGFVHIPSCFFSPGISGCYMPNNFEENNSKVFMK